MSSNSSYYQNNQQTSAKQYSGYQTAPASSNDMQPSRQYQQTPSVATTQSQEYVGYNSYSEQGNTNGEGQDGFWGSGSYGENCDLSSRAAEALRSLSNTAYARTELPVVSSSGFTRTRAPASTGYSTSTPQLPLQQHSHASHTTYGKAQPRPRSVSPNLSQSTSSRGLPPPATSAGYPSQQAQALYNQQQKQSASAVQDQYSHSTMTPVSTAMTAATQYQDYSPRQPSSVDTAQKVQKVLNPAIAPSYSYGDTQIAAPIEQTPSSISVSEQYNNPSTITVDPIAVYDPWSEYQRKQEALRMQKAAEDAARAEEERKKAEEKEKTEQERREIEAQVPVALPPSQSLPRKGPSGKTTLHQQSPASERPAAGGSSNGAAVSLEAEMRAMLSKMRELSGKDPALLARIWEEERRAKGPKSPTVQNKATPQPATAQPVQANASRTAKPQEVVTKETTTSSTSAYSHSHAPSGVTMAPVTKTHTPASTPSTKAVPAVPSSSRPVGNTIWPPEKKAQLANAASSYLNLRNKDKPITSETILSMLDSNPSYIELCEQLESMQLKLDRAGFAKNLLTAVPDVNSGPRQSQANQARKAQIQRHSLSSTSQQNGNIGHRVQVQSPAVTTASPHHLKNQSIPQNRNSATPAAVSPGYALTTKPLEYSPPQPFPDTEVSHSSVAVAEVVPVKAGLKAPVNKEEAARKRTFDDLIDLTLPSEEEDGPPSKKSNVSSTIYSYTSPGSTPANLMNNSDGMTGTHIPTPAIPSPATMSHVSSLPANDLKMRNIVQQIDKKNALRRNSYNIKTIARDVLLACGRHPDERQLNGHLEILKIHLPQVDNNSDLSTLRWDIIDPGDPPRGFYKDQSQILEVNDADDEDSEDERGIDKKRAPARQEARNSGVSDTVRALPEATNPFKIKRRGRPPRHSFPQESSRDSSQHINIPRRSSGIPLKDMSAPRPNAAAVGYSAFRSTTESVGPDGNPLPKKKGRPVGWRKHIHGSAAAQVRPTANGHAGPKNWTPSQPSSLRNVRTGNDHPIVIRSRSPSIANRPSIPRYQSFKCKWQGCQADLHNLETLKKHVQKVHRKETLRGMLECLWGDCGREITSRDTVTGFTVEKATPFSFPDEGKWREHLELRHFGPLSWNQGDGPASGLSDANDPASEAYLSDAQGRRVTPRITADASHVSEESLKTTPRSRGRPRKVTTKQEAQDKLNQAIARKRRLGAPGMEKSGSTLANEKRRRGFVDQDDLEGGYKVVDVSD